MGRKKSAGLSLVLLEGASNRMIDVEDLTEDEIEVLHKHYQKLVAKSAAEVASHHFRNI